MPDNPLSSLYPPPPQQSQGSLLTGDPSKVIDIARGVGALSLLPLQRQYLQTTVQGQQIQNETGLLALHTGQNQFVTDRLGALADMPNPTLDDVYSFMATAARNSNIPTPVLTAWMRTLPSDPAGLKRALVTLRNMSIGSAGVSTPDVTGFDASGAPITGTRGQAGYERAGVGATAAPAPTEPQAPGVVGLSPGFETAATAGATALGAARDAAGTYQERVNPVRSAISILGNMRETDIGPTSEKWNELKSAAQTLGLGTIAGIDPNKIKDFNELKKYLTQYSSLRAQGLGPRTNEGLATAVTSNPNVSMDRLSAQELSKVALSLERMRQAQTLSFEDAVAQRRASPGQYGAWTARWNTQMDPRAFVYDLLSPQAQQALLKSFRSPIEKQRFEQSMILAERYGLLGDVRE